MGWRQVLLGAVLSALVLSGVMLVGTLARERVRMEAERRAAKARRLCRVNDGSEVQPPTLGDGFFHVFLSQ